jgi:uncharacterized protein YdeI (YjbR/CyaY-like superfamily)
MKSSTKPSGELPVILFEKKNDWADWLDKQHAESAGVWLRIAKKDSGIQSVSYDEALEVALCYGWIDGQKQSYDETSWLQKFTRRGEKSTWSKINRGKVQALIDSGHMKPAGLTAIEKAKKDGRWDSAYDSPGNAAVPDDFQAALDNNPEAKDFFEKLNRANRYAILFRIQTAKKVETRTRRIEEFIRMLERHEKLHP